MHIHHRENENYRPSDMIQSTTRVVLPSQPKQYCLECTKVLSPSN